MTADNLLPYDGEAALTDAWLAAADADACLAALQHELAWRAETLTMFGRRVAVPRLVAWYGDPGVRYSYSGTDHVATGWPPSLAALRERLRESTGFVANGVLGNLYRGAGDSMGWHADREPELGPRPTIASLSLGAARPFELRHRESRGVVRVILGHGSLLMMRGTCQQAWQHRLPKVREPCGLRINLTFRAVLHASGAPSMRRRVDPSL